MLIFGYLLLPQNMYYMELNNVPPKGELKRTPSFSIFVERVYSSFFIYLFLSCNNKTQFLQIRNICVHILDFSNFFTNSPFISHKEYVFFKVLRFVRRAIELKIAFYSNSRD